MREELRELWRFRELLWSMTERELRIRYKNSVLGFLWSLINPLITVGVMTLVFKYFLGQSVGSYTLYVLAAYLPFLFFQFALLDSAQSVLQAIPIVKKVYFPREILPLSQILANFIHLIMAFCVFFLICTVVWARHPGAFPVQSTVVLLPFLLLINLALSVGLGLLVSALNTFMEDVKYILSAVLYVGFFLTPVMYFSESVQHAMGSKGKLGEALYLVYHLNPMATLCTAYKKILLAPTPVPSPGKEGGTLPPLPIDWPMIGVAACVSLAALIFGYAVFNRLKWRFVERP